MAKPPVRVGYVARIFQGFWNSLKNKRHHEEASTVVGQDFKGNRYYEIPADPR